MAMCTAATMLTRFLPFLIFSSKDQQPPEVVRYLGRVLPAAIFGMLIVYCLKGVNPLRGSHGIPEAIAIAATIALHKWKHQTLASIAGGHGLLCAAGAAGVLGKSGSVIEGVKVHLTVEPLLQLVKAFAVLRQQPHTFWSLRPRWSYRGPLRSGSGCAPACPLRTRPRRCPRR